MRPLLSLAVAVAALAIAGCGSGTDSTPAPSSSSTPATPSGGVSAGTITIKNFAFDPADATVKVGQKVTWTNEDTAVHNVVSSDGTLKSKDLAQGDSYSFTAKKPGTISYVCTYHPNMKATLTVTG